MPRAGRHAVALSLGGAVLFFTLATVASVTPVPGALAFGAVGPAAEMVAAPPTAPPPPPSAAPLVVPTSPDEWFSPGGANEGTEGLIRYLAELAMRDNPRLGVTASWGRSWGPSTSDHHYTQTSSWATDLAIPGVPEPNETVHLGARRIASALGHPGWTSGNLVTTVRGYRFQLLWMVAGHYNHLHLGVRKVG